MSAPGLAQRAKYCQPARGDTINPVPVPSSNNVPIIQLGLNSRPRARIDIKGAPIKAVPDDHSRDSPLQDLPPTLPALEGMGRLPFPMGTARLEDDLLYKSKHLPSLLQYVLYVGAIQVRHLAH